MTLEKAWEKRLALCASAAKIIKKAEELKKSCFQSPPNAKVTVWYGAISAYYDVDELNGFASASLKEADLVWKDAILAVKGDIRIAWEHIENRGWKCTLETGEVFEP